VNDCSNAEIRDQLPDLLHDRLSDGARATVLAHVDGCADCRNELALLRSLQGMLATAAPRIDTSRIARALPAPPSRTAAPRRASRWSDWRIAATITVLAVGGTSIALVTRSGDRAQTIVQPRTESAAPETAAARTNAVAAPTPSAPDKPVARPESANVQTTTVSAASADEPGAETAMEGRLTGLNEQQLRALLDDIGQLKSTPMTDPEPIMIKVDTKASSGSAGDQEQL
jgi:anti-sigma factor RsiW